MQDSSSAGNTGPATARPADPSAKRFPANPRASRAEPGSEQEIRKSEDHYRRLFEAAQDGILILDAETGVVVDANPAMEELLGYPPAEILGRNLWETGILKGVAASAVSLGELLRHDRFRWGLLSLETKGGARAEVDFSSSLYFEGERQFIQCNFRGVAERKASEMASLRLAAIVDSSEDAIIGKDLHGIVTSWNHGAERIFGYTADEMVGTPIMRLIPAEREAEEALILGKIERGESLEHLETIRQTKDGRRIQVSVTASPIKDASGQVLGVSKVARDITAMKRVETALLESQETLRMSLTAARLGHWVFDLRTLATERSPLHDRIFGYDELLPQWTHEDFLNHVHPDDRMRVDRLFRAGMMDKKDWDFECRIIRRDGELRWIWAHGNVITNAAGDAVQMAGVVSDITERKVAEEAIAREQERFKLIFETVPVGIALATTLPDGRITRVINGAHLRICGLTAEEDQIPGIYRRLRHPDESELQDELYRRMDAGEISEFTIEKRFVRLDGSVVWVVFSLQRWKFADGRTEQLSTVVDITERKRAEAALAESEERFRTMTNSMPQLAWVAKADGFISWYNDRWYEYTGTTPEQMAGYSWQSVHDPEVLPRVMDEWTRAIVSGEPFEMEYPLRGADGKSRTFLTRAHPLKDAEGRVTQWLGTNTDVETLKQAEAAVRRSEEYFRFLNDLSEATRTLADPSQIMEVTARMLGEYMQASRCAYADVESDSERFTILHDYTDGCASTVGGYQLSLFGQRAVETLRGGRTLIIRDVGRELLPEDGADMFAAIGIQATIICPLVKDGKLRAMMAVHQTTPREWSTGEIAMVQEVVERCWATIERRAAEEKIQQFNAELEQRVIERTAQFEMANKELEAFSYSVSHDLRAPLRAVDGFSQAVVDDYSDVVPDECRRYLQVIRDSAQKMGMLIDDLLTFSRLSRLPLGKQRVNVADLVRSVVAELEPQQSGRRIEVEIGPLPDCEGDASLLRQVWINLLSNAMKYTRNREVARVEIGFEPTAEGNAYFVRDNGTGFDMRYAEKLFGVFQRLHRAEDYEGTGVGLAIVQRVIHRHGGHVWADAAVDRGATFHFTLEGKNES
jgi:PAS domain S-box-containing protein